MSCWKKSHLNGRRSGQEHVMKKILAAAIAAIMFGAVSAQAQTPAAASATGKKVTGTFTGVFTPGIDLGITPVMPNQCTRHRRIAEVAAAEKGNCEKAGGKYAPAICSCDLATPNKALADDKQLAFCRVESDAGTARFVHAALDCRVNAETEGARSSAYYARHAIDGDLSCRRLAAGKYASSKKGAAAKARDLKACKNKGLKSAVATAESSAKAAGAKADAAAVVGLLANGKIDKVGSDLSALTGRVGEGEAAQKATDGRVGSLEVQMNGGEKSACAQIDEARANGDTVSQEVFIRCHGVAATAVDGDRRSREAKIAADEAKIAAEAAKKAAADNRPRFGIGLEAGAVGQPMAKAGAIVKRGGFAYGWGIALQLRMANIALDGEIAFPNEMTTRKPGVVGSVEGAETRLGVAYLFASSDTLKVGPEIGARVDATGGAMYAAAYSEGGYAGCRVLWQLADHFEISGHVFAGYETVEAKIDGKPPALTSGADLGVAVGALATF